MHWQALYAEKLTTADKAIAATVKSGCRVFLTGNCSIPRTLVGALVAAAPQLQDIEITHALTVGPGNFTAPELHGHLRSNALFIGANVRQAVWEGRADFTPVLLSEFPTIYKSALPLDVAFVHLSPPDDQGYCTFGIEAGLTKTPAEAAKAIVAQINPNMPRTLGDTTIHIKDLHSIVEVDDPLYEYKMAEDPNDPVTQAIAGHIAALIPDGATMQLGIGALPDAVLPYLEEKRDLGIHTELFSDGVRHLVEKGIITGARKSIHKGKIAAGFLLGSAELYKWADNNPLVELHRTEYINDPFVIAQNSRQVAINAALEVDLTGQVCADSIGTKLYSGVGGQLDFIYGAGRSQGGVPIIALPATAKNGTLSRITAVLKSGAGVTTTRNHVHWVVTEYGAVDLYGKSVRQRARALISIAAPQFRDELTRTAKEMQYL